MTDSYNYYGDTPHSFDDSNSYLLKKEIRLQYMSTFELQNKSDDLIYFYTANFLFYGFKINPLRVTWDSEKYNKEVFSEYVGIMIFLSGEAYIGEFSAGFKPNGEGMMFFVVGSTLKGFFHEGKVHNNVLISLPFDILIYAKFNKGVINSQVIKINTNQKTAKTMRYVQGKFKEIIKEGPADENLETFIRDSFSINLIPDDIGICNEPDVVYFGSFLHSQDTVYYGFARDGNPMGWGILVTLVNDSPDIMNPFSYGEMSWQMTFFDPENPVIKKMAFQIEPFPKMQGMDSNNQCSEFSPFDKMFNVNEVQTFTDTNDLDLPGKNRNYYDRDPRSRESIRFSRHVKNDPSLFPMIINYRQSRMIYGVGKNLDLVGSIGMYIPTENRFEKAHCLSNLIYTAEPPDFFEGIPRNFITDIFRYFLEHNKIEKKETFILPTVFDLTYFNEAFFFYLYGFLKSKSREVFPDNLEIIQPTFFKDHRLGTQSNHNSWTDSEMTSYDYRFRKEQRNLASLTQDRMSSRPSLGNIPKLMHHAMFRSDNQKFQLPVAPPLVHPQPEPKFTNDSNNLLNTASRFKNNQQIFGVNQMKLSPDNEIEEVDEVMMELSQNPFNKKNKVVFQDIQGDDANPLEENHNTTDPQINYKGQNFLFNKSGSGVFKRNYDSEKGLENSRLSKDNDESALVKNLKMQQDISFGFRSDYSKSLRFSRQGEDVQDNSSPEHSTPITEEQPLMHKESLPEDRDPDGFSNEYIAIPTVHRNKDEIAQSFRRKLELVFGGDEAKKICCANSFLSRTYGKAK